MLTNNINLKQHAPEVGLIYITVPEYLETYMRHINAKFEDVKNSVLFTDAYDLSLDLPNNLENVYKELIGEQIRNYIITKSTNINSPNFQSKE